MSGAAIFTAFCRISHGRSVNGVLLEVDAACLAIFEFKCNAPRPVDVDRIALRIQPVQGMKVEARDVHFLSSDSKVETIEPRENAFMHFRINLRTPRPCSTIRKGLAFEGSDHEPM